MDCNMDTKSAARRARDFAEIKNLYAAHAYCMGAQKQRYELETYWAKERDDIVYAVGDDAWVGRELVYAYYADSTERAAHRRLSSIHQLDPENVEDSDENLNIGDLCIRGGSTPQLEIAGDGRTAKGVWQTISLTSYLDSSDTPIPFLAVGRDLVEFIREEDGWKIWHFRVLRDFQWRTSEDLVLNKTRLFRTVGNSGTMVPATVKLRPFEMEGNYNTRRVPKFAPPLPKPTPTWDEEQSFCYVVGRLDADPDCMPGGAYYVEPEDE